jgi:hypothetical protein
MPPVPRRSAATLFSAARLTLVLLLGYSLGRLSGPVPGRASLSRGAQAGVAVALQPPAAPAARTGFAVVCVLTLDARWFADVASQHILLHGLGGMSRYADAHGYSFRPRFFAPEARGQPAVDKRVNWNRVRASLRECASSRVQWVYFTEGDVWITNFTTTLESIVSDATRDAPQAHVVLNRDLLGNLNTGSGFVKCSQLGMQALREVLQASEAHAGDTYVQAWGDQGAFMLLAQDQKWAPHIAIAPQKAFNAYPVHVPDWTRFEEGGPGDAHFWARGDFAIHFAGFYKGGLMSFAKALGERELRVGYREFMDVLE